MLNGDGKVIINRLTMVEHRMELLEAAVTENLKYHRDHPLCPAPGLCVALEKQIGQNADEIADLAVRLDETRKLVWKGIGVVLTTSIMFGVIAPFIITHIINGAK